MHPILAAVIKQRFIWHFSNVLFIYGEHGKSIGCVNPTLIMRSMSLKRLIPLKIEYLPVAMDSACTPARNVSLNSRSSKNESVLLRNQLFPKSEIWGSHCTQVRCGECTETWSIFMCQPARPSLGHFTIQASKYANIGRSMRESTFNCYTYAELDNVCAWWRKTGVIYIYPYKNQTTGLLFESLTWALHSFPSGEHTHKLISFPKDYSSKWLRSAVLHSSRGETLFRRDAQFSFFVSHKIFSYVFIDNKDSTGAQYVRVPLP